MFSLRLQKRIETLCLYCVWDKKLVEDLKHCLNQGNFVDGNALLVDENRNHSDWAKYIKKLVENPNMVKDMGERLYETVKDTYDLTVVTKNRAEFYKSLIN